MIINNGPCIYLQRNFIREEPRLSMIRGKLYSNFLTWVRGKYGGEPTSTEWNAILDEDDQCSSTSPAGLPSQTTSEDPYHIECDATPGPTPQSSQDATTDGELSPQIL